jgi:hypothetical protein
MDPIRFASSTASIDAPLPHDCLELCNMVRHEVLNGIHFTATKAICGLCDNSVNIRGVNVLGSASLKTSSLLLGLAPPGFPCQLHRGI